MAIILLIGGATARRCQYTSQGLRVRKWTSSNTSGNTYFVYNENAQLIGEYDNAGARVQEIIWLGNLPIGVIAGTAAVPVLHYIESDHLGTPRVIVEATRNVGIWRWNQTNDPFGESTPNQNPDGDATSFTFNLRFAGQYRDSESGWYYNVHRYYDPSIGRYLESDPIGLGGGISTYSYVGAAPLTAVDPLGLWSVQAGGYIPIAPLVLGPVGPGGSITIQGSWEDFSIESVSFRFGVGAGGGVSLNPFGMPPDQNYRDLPCGEKEGIGFYAELSGAAGPVGAGTSWGWGGTRSRSADGRTHWQEYGGIDSAPTLGPRVGSQAQVGAGLELTKYF